jgi:hypothetical protein
MLASRPTMPRICAEITVEASAAEIWQVLIDLDRYPEWNRFTPRITLASADLRPGAELDLDCRMSERELLSDEHEVILAVEPKRHALCMGTSRTRGRLGIASERWQICEPLGPDRTRFVNWEQFRGVIAPLVYLLYAPRLRRAFADYCASLARRVASLRAAGAMAQQADGS